GPDPRRAPEERPVDHAVGLDLNPRPDDDGAGVRDRLNAVDGLGLLSPSMLMDSARLELEALGAEDGASPNDRVSTDGDAFEHGRVRLDDDARTDPDATLGNQPEQVDARARLAR